MEKAFGDPSRQGSRGHLLWDLGAGSRLVLGCPAGTFNGSRRMGGTGVCSGWGPERVLTGGISGRSGVPPVARVKSAGGSDDSEKAGNLEAEGNEPRVPAWGPTPVSLSKRLINCVWHGRLVEWKCRGAWQASGGSGAL